MAAVTPQSLVEHALATSTTDHCLVIAQDSTSANLRFPSAGIIWR